LLNVKVRNCKEQGIKEQENKALINLIQWKTTITNIPRFKDDLQV